jgi:exodeoxyribonuclease V alpha subunit
MNDPDFFALDRYFARFLTDHCGLAGAAKENFQAIVVRVCKALEDGHSCLPVDEEEVRLLACSPMVSDGGRTPLVLHAGRLYLHRYFHYETRLAAQIKTMAAITFPLQLNDSLIDAFFDSDASTTDWQKEAAKVALHRALTLICGGPGTGKTTTVVKILALLMQVQEGGRDLAIALAAPTGKAAMRLSAAIDNSLARIALPQQIKNIFPAKAVTLHRLLGVQRGSPQFRHNHDNPLEWDVVVVDEASMVDLAMMSKLVDAIKPGARLILLGDKDQLASVESGAVFGDFIKSLPGNRIELQKTYRFEADIKGLAEAINAADCNTAWEHLHDTRRPNVSLVSGALINLLSERYSRFMTMASHPGMIDVHGVFTLFNSFRVLCALHYGGLGVEQINRQVELSLGRCGFFCRPDTWYPGRPILITKNDYSLDLYNGDVGICLASPENGDLQIWFERAGGRLQSYPPSRLPGCETVFAMTIHKSQGSEFDEVVLVLPDEDNRILSRELVYTAVTRAKKSVQLFVDKEILRIAVTKNIERFSGLADFLKDSNKEML